MLPVPLTSGDAHARYKCRCFAGAEPSSAMEQPVRESHRDFLDAKAFERFKDYSLKVDTDALGRITFEHAPREDHAHLDIGCGPGTFTKDFLLPCSEPCARLVAIDNSPLMIEFAMENFNDDKLAYEVFDFGRMEAGELVKKHGHFDRVYSFLCFHLVKDQWKCFRDIATLLTPKHGECVVAFFMSFPLADAWLQVHSMNRWSDLIPDPRPLLSAQLRYNFNGSPDKMECEVREMVRASGLTCVACHVYETEWAFPNAEAYVEAIFDSFGFPVPESDLGACKADWSRALQGYSTEKQSGCHLKMLTCCVHAKTPDC